MRRKIVIATVVLVVIPAAFIFCLFTGVFAPAAPQSWSQVHAGMTRSEVIALIGTPLQSGWPEKTAETWQRSGFVSDRRLFIAYEGERVLRLWDGIWVSGWGWSRFRKESL